MARRPSPHEVPAPYRYRVVADDRPDSIGRLDQNGTKIQRGRGTLTIPIIMEVFDCLPKSIRIALANSAHDWAPHWAQFCLARHAMAAVIERLQRADREEAQKREVQLLMGKG